VHIETRTKVTVPEAQKLLNSALEAVVMDDRDTGGYPAAATDAAGRNADCVGRVRKDLSHLRGLDSWIVVDNIRKGAATK
jgi:aspartate-semialdehyde dehydrogenase